MKEYVDVKVLKQQDFQDYSREDVEYAIDHCPRADVVPKGVVDALKLEVENEILKRERQRQILNHYTLQYGTVRDQQAVIDKAKSEVAWEIFKEIYEDCFDQFGYIDYDALIQLKKKYTGGE